MLSIARPLYALFYLVMMLFVVRDKQVAERESLKQFADLHARLGAHAKSMKIRVKYLPAKKRS